MSGTLKRKMAPKRWAQVYTDRQDSILQKRLEKEQRDAEERAFILKQREEKRRQEKERAEYEAEVADEVASDSSADSPKGTRPPPKSPTKLRMVIRDCRHTIENLSPPPKQKDWSAHWGTCLACYLCNRPAINDCTVCPKCNLIYHNLCHSYQSGISSRYSSDICPNCDEEHQLDMLHYYEMVDKLRTEKIRSISAEIITRRAHVFLARKNLKWARQMITMIQAIVRGKMARNKYKINRRSFFRVVLMNILQLPQYADVPLKHILLVITINDTYKNIQLFRFDKTAETVFDETILVPGIAAYMTVIFTLGVREEVYTYNLVGQAQLSVRDMVNAAHRKEYVLNFMDNILFMPQDTEHIKPVAFLTNGHRPKPLDDMQIRLQYAPQNPVLYFCTWASGPPIDLLRRSVQHLNNKKKQEAISGGGTYRNSKYWLCTTHNVLWFYQYYGDIAPRFGVQIHEASASMVKEKKHSTTLANLVLSDGRVWLLDFSSKSDAERFEVAVTENRKAHNSKSIYIKSLDATVPVPELGFTVLFF